MVLKFRFTTLSWSIKYFHSTGPNMAKSKFEYVRNFETDDKCLPNTWIVVRVDGKAFHKFSAEHEYEKPNDRRALALMNRCATAVMEELKEICVAYGQSDEYSFVFRKDAQVKLLLYPVINSIYLFIYVTDVQQEKFQVVNKCLLAFHLSLCLFLERALLHTSPQVSSCV